MNAKSGTGVLLDLFHQEGVEFIFGNPGTTELPLMDALAGDNRFRYILGLHEAVAVGMADGYAQASRQLAVVNLHVTPGLGNALGMLYDAQKSGAPILVTAGQHEQRLSISEPILHGDLPTLARPMAKWSYEVRSLPDLPVAVHRAIKTALSVPTGPVFLSLPSDVMTGRGNVSLGRPNRVSRRIRGEREAIEAAAELLAAAERPIVMAGDAVAQTDAHAELVELVEMLQAPVYAETIASTASFPSSHPLFCGTVARLGPSIRKLMEQHDLLLSIGADLFTVSLPSDTEPAPEGLVVVHMDVDPWELGKNIPTSVGIFGDPKATLPDLTAALAARMGAPAREGAARRGRSTREEIARRRSTLTAAAAAEAATVPILPRALLHAIGQALPSDAVVVEEALSSAGDIRLLIPANDPQSFFGMRGGGIGWGLPAALGVKLALPNRPVVALVGDGSALFTIQALWTAAHYKIAVVFLILNNSSYRILKQRTAALHGISAQTKRYVAMDLTEPAIDFVGLAQSFGVTAARATTVEDTVRLLNKALAEQVPMLIDVQIERGVGRA